MSDALRQTIASVDADVATSAPTTLNQILSSAVAPRRFDTVLMEGFAAAGLLLATIGLYAVLSYTVAQQRYEMAIRIALGASRRSVLRLVIFQGMREIHRADALAVIGNGNVENRAEAHDHYEEAPLSPYIFARRRDSSGFALSQRYDSRAIRPIERAAVPIRGDLCAKRHLPPVVASG